MTADSLSPVAIPLRSKISRRRSTTAFMRVESFRRIRSSNCRAGSFIGARRVIPFPQIYILPGLPGSLILVPSRTSRSMSEMISSPNSGKIPRRRASWVKSP